MNSFARKVVVDSRYFLNNAPAESGTFELPETITPYDQDVLYLQQFHCMVSWWTIDDSNDTMYLIEQQAVGAGLKTARTIKITHGPYDIDSLAAQLTTQMNDSSTTTVREEITILKRLRPATLTSKTARADVFLAAATLTTISSRPVAR